MVRSLLLLSSLIVTACAGDEPSTSAQASEGAPAAVAPTQGMADDAEIATWDGGSITWGELHEAVEGDLQQAEVEYLTKRHQTLSQALEQQAMEALLETEAEERGMEVEAMLKEEIEGTVEQPTDAEVEAFYEQVKSQVRGAPLEQVRPLIEQELVRQKQIEKYRAYVEQLKEESGYESKLPFPDLPRIDMPISDDDPVKGPADAPVTILEFADFQCPYCARVAPTIERILEEYEGKVKLVYKDYPLPNHDRAVPAAVASYCAAEEGKYWEMHDILMDNQQALGDADLIGYAGTIGLDVDAFESCLEAGKYEEAVQADMEAGQEVGVQSTPTFLVNGIMIKGAQPYEQFASVIDRELESAE